ncbi:hypothetical protein Bca101_003914 [Brassica carinata]
MADEQNKSLQQDQQGAELKRVTQMKKDHTSELKGAASTPLPKDHASPSDLKGAAPTLMQKDHAPSELKGAAPTRLQKDHASPSELKGAAPTPLQKDHASESSLSWEFGSLPAGPAPFDPPRGGCGSIDLQISACGCGCGLSRFLAGRNQDESKSSVDENVPPAETLQSATVPEGHEIEEVATVNPDGTGPVNEAGAGAGNDAQDGVVYTCCRNLWAFLYGEQFGRPYFLMAQATVTLVLAVLCAYEARGVSTKDEKYAQEFSIALIGPGFYFAVSVMLFDVKQQMTTMYENARTKLANYLCIFKGLRAILVMGMLRLFVRITDILAEKKHPDIYALGFYYLSALHVITVVKLFTVEDILCLSGSLLAVGILVSSRIEAEGLGTDNDALLTKVVLLVGAYTFGVLIVCFKFATIPYGNQPEDATEDGTGPANEPVL